MATTESFAAAPFLLGEDWSLADLQQHLAEVPLSRVRLRPAPGTATEEDVLRIQAREGRLYELVDGILVEKAMGHIESLVEAVLVHVLLRYLDEHPLGVVYTGTATFRILPNCIRLPDVSFVRWAKLPERAIPPEPVPSLVPNLAVEILSASNSRAEMETKLREYFEAGVELVWYIDPARRAAAVHTSVDHCEQIGPQGTLHGGEVLPGFEIALAELFARANLPIMRDP